MAVALTGTQQNGLLAPATTSVSLTVPVGTSTVVVLLLRKSTGASGFTSTPTLGGVAANFWDGAQTGTALLNAYAAVFHNPGTGAQTFSFTHSSAPSGTNAGTRWVAVYLSGTDTSQTSWTLGTDWNRDNATTGTTYSRALTAFADGVVISGVAHEGASIMTSKGTGQVGAGADADGFVDEGNWNSAFTYELTASAGSDTQSFVNGASDILAGISIALKPGSNVVNKTGGATTGALHGGTTQSTALLTKAGGSTSIARDGGPKAVVVSKTGGVVSLGTHGGTAYRGEFVSKAGGATSVCSAGGASTYSVAFNKTGGATSIKTAGTPKSVVVVKAGGASTPQALGGSSATAALISKTGGNISIARVGGPGVSVQIVSKAGGATRGSTAGGARVAIVSKTGGFVSPRLVGGTKSVVVIATKAGGAITARTVGGTRVVLLNKNGGVTSVARTGGLRSLIKTASGGAITAQSVGGSKAVTIVFIRTGGSTLNALAGGPDSTGNDVSRQGGAIFTPQAGGIYHVQIAKSGGARTTSVVNGNQRTYANRSGLAHIGTKAGGIAAVVVSATGGSVLPVTVGSLVVVGRDIQVGGGAVAIGRTGGTSDQFDQGVPMVPLGTLSLITTITPLSLVNQTILIHGYTPEPIRIYIDGSRYQTSDPNPTRRTLSERVEDQTIALTKTVVESDLRTLRYRVIEGDENHYIVAR
jgi:hypothetical protein